MDVYKLKTARKTQKQQPTENQKILNIKMLTNWEPGLYI